MKHLILHVLKYLKVVKKIGSEYVNGEVSFRNVILSVLREIIHIQGSHKL